MSDTPNPVTPTALDYCVEIAEHERMADYVTCWDDVAVLYQSPGALADAARKELAALRRTVANQAAEIKRLMAYVERLYLCNGHAIPGPCTCDWTTGGGAK